MLFEVSQKLFPATQSHWPVSDNLMSPFQDIQTKVESLAHAFFTAVTLAGQNTLLMATENLQVEVRDLKAAGKCSHTFPTIGKHITIFYFCEKNIRDDFFFCLIP